MVRGKLSGLMIGALVLVAIGARGYAAETTVKAAAPIKGEGRFYKIWRQPAVVLGLFSGQRRGGGCGATSMGPAWCVRA